MPPRNARPYRTSIYPSPVVMSELERLKAQVSNLKEAGGALHKVVQDIRRDKCPSDTTIDDACDEWLLAKL